MKNLQISDLIKNGFDFEVTAEVAGMAYTFYMVECDYHVTDITARDIDFFVEDSSDEELAEMFPELAKMLAELNRYFGRGVKFSASDFVTEIIDAVEMGEMDAAEIFNSLI